MGSRFARLKSLVAQHKNCSARAQTCIARHDYVRENLRDFWDDFENKCPEIASRYDEKPYNLSLERRYDRRQINISTPGVAQERALGTRPYSRGLALNAV